MKHIFAIFLYLSFYTQSFAQQLVLPGDYPDPSVVKIGDTYWASATTSNWLPTYPLLQSKDLIHWKTVGFTFEQLPAWADYYFWAPEISHENGKTYIYYTAHKKGGNLCIAVASADKPEGPYRDHGTLMCQEAGSIDAFPMRDENGKLYMIWKEDGNSVGKPTPIWAMEMNEARTALIGEKKELFRGDAAWENKLVEGASMIRHGDYYYAFYAAAACCGRGCTYGTGIARAKKLLGPWEKYAGNPVSVGDKDWKCPGHGTPIEKDGKFYFLYHAYNTASDVYAGRQGLLTEFKFTLDGWIEFVAPTTPDVTIAKTITDNFNSKSLSNNWQWNVFQPLNYVMQSKRLKLSGLSNSAGAFIGQKTYGLNYTADVIALTKESDAWAGLAAIGDERNVVNVLVNKDSIQVMQIKDDRITVIANKAIRPKSKVYLQMQVRNGKDITFLYSINGKNYTPINNTPVDGTYLPPWDRAVRVGLISKGTATQKAVFQRFILRN